MCRVRGRAGATHRRTRSRFPATCPDTPRLTGHRVLVDATRAAGTQWNSGADSDVAATELWNALRVSIVPLTGEGPQASGRLGRFAAPGSKYASLMRELLTQGTTFGGMAQQWEASQKLCRSSGGAVRIRDHSEREGQDSRGDGDAGIA